MARDIDFDDVSAGDVEYMHQRPWLKREYELQTGRKFDDLADQFDDGDDDEESSAGSTDAQEVSTLRRRLEDRDQRIVELEGELQVARNQLTEILEQIAEEEEDRNYGEWEYNELVEAVKTRELETDGRKTEDLIRALEADDNARDAAEDEGSESSEE